MRTFQCACGQPLFFANRQCLACGAEVAYDPTCPIVSAMRPAPEGTWYLVGDKREPPPAFKFCGNRTGVTVCNWLVPAGDPETLCLSCRLTRTVPNLDRPKNPERLSETEAAKRRVLYDLQSLGLPLVPLSVDPEHGLAFDLLETLPDAPPVITGHLAGVITLNVAEADADYRERNRENLREPYRTVLGHLRHELAHYYWDHLVRGSEWLVEFRKVFGDEQMDYGDALRRHYAEGPPVDWRTRFISAYAASHPWEDWAESWAHYLHVRATLETVTSLRLDASRAPLLITAFNADVLYRRDPAPAGEAFLACINAWVLLTAVMNEVARSMGQPDIYPFVLNGPVVTKLHFVHCVIEENRAVRTGAPPSRLPVPGE